MSLPADASLPVSALEALDAASAAIAAEVSLEGVLQVITSEIKRHKDSVEQYRAGNRQDLVDKESAELAVLSGYLPQRLDAAAIAAEVAANVAELGAAGPGDMGKVMGAVKTRLAGKADMGLVSAAVKAALTK